MQKTVLQALIRVDHCKKTALKKKKKYSRNEKILKIRHLAKAIAHANTVAFARLSFSVKN